MQLKLEETHLCDATPTKANLVSVSSFAIYVNDENMNAQHRIEFIELMLHFSVGRKACRHRHTHQLNPQFFLQLLLIIV